MAKSLEANFTAATLLGVERQRLPGSFLAHFLAKGDREVFRQVMANILQQQQQQQQQFISEARMGKAVSCSWICILTRRQKTTSGGGQP